MLLGLSCSCSRLPIARSLQPLAYFRQRCWTFCRSNTATFIEDRREVGCPIARGRSAHGSLCVRSSCLSAGKQSRTVVLGIESSCDDTGVAVVSSDGQVLGEVLLSQAAIHAPWGGVVPNLAKEAHEAAMDAAVEQVLQMASVSADQLDAVAVTIGPGLSLCLKVGVTKAHAIAAEHGLPLVPVHHMEAHALVARMGRDLSFPFVCLLVSGGHNLLLTAHGVGEYTLLGSTLDDAIGEAYDKTARLLGLEMTPNFGAALEVLALQGDAHKYPFTLPLKQRSCANFSYAGLKNAVRMAIEAEAPGPATEENYQVRADIAASFQHIAVRHLAERTRRGTTWALEADPRIRSLVVAGGVAANAHVREHLGEVAASLGLELVCPGPALCTDNGIMVAWAGLERLQRGLWKLPPPTGVPQGEDWIDVRPRWPLTDDRDPRSAAEKRSARKARIFTSLTDLTRAIAISRGLAPASIPTLVA